MKDDYPTHRPFWADPHHRVGGWLFGLSRQLPYPRKAPFVGIIGLFALLTAVAYLPDVPGLGIVVLLGALVVLFGSVIVGQFADERLCPACGYPHTASFHYCPACAYDYREATGEEVPADP